MIGILRTHMTAVHRHPAVRQTTTPETAADTAEAARAEAEATAAAAGAVPVVEEDSKTIKTDIP